MSGISEHGESVYVSTFNSNQYLMQRTTLPRVVFPEHIPADFPGEVPDVIVAEYSQAGRQFGLRILAPIVRKDEYLGVLVGEIFFAQHMVERYASLSHTAINFFVGNRLSIGTLARQEELSQASSKALCRAICFSRKKTQLPSSLKQLESRSIIKEPIPSPLVTAAWRGH